MTATCLHPDCAAMNGYLDGQGDAYELAAATLRVRAEGKPGGTWWHLRRAADELDARAEVIRRGERICWERPRVTLQAGVARPRRRWRWWS